MKISVIVCAHNETLYISACLHSVLAQSRVPDELLVISNASTDETGAVATSIGGARVLIALSAPYRFCDWDWWGRTLIRAYDFTLAPR